MEVILQQTGNEICVLISEKEIKRRIKLFTHTDYDGVGCAILAKILFGDDVDIEYCDYEDINEKVEKFVKDKEYLNYAHVYITDINISDELAEYIDCTESDDYKETFTIAEYFTLIDHHKSEMRLARFWWCHVIPEDDNGKTSGTSLFHRYLDEEKLNTPIIKQFVETVRRYDTWEWKTKYNDETALNWSSLLYIYGRDMFIERHIDTLTTNSDYVLNNEDILLLKVEKIQKQIEFERKNKDMETIYLLGYKVGIIFGERFQSEMGNYLAEKNPELDFIIIIGSKKINYRGVKHDIDLGEFAKRFGGGGHPQAAGSEIDKQLRLNYIKSLFQIE